MKSKKHTLISAVMYENDYVVTIGTKLGEFTGATTCKPEDQAFKSHYLGFELAEIKAEIAYARAERNRAHNELTALLHFWRDMSKTRTFDESAFWVKKIKQRTDALTDEYHSWEEKITALQNLYVIKVRDFDKHKSIMQKRIKKNDKKS